MNFITPEFVLFFLPVLLVGWLLRSKTGGYRFFLILCCLFFYACSGITFLPLLVFVALLDWGTVRVMASEKATPGLRRVTVTVDIVLHILLLAFFKYYEFFIVNVTDVLVRLDIPVSSLFSSEIADLLFPVGLSFFTFQGLSYAIDHYREPSLPSRRFSEVLAYVSFFPTIMAGPILREQEFFPQLKAPVRDPRAFQEGFALILSGLFKKVVLATYLSEHIVNQVFETPESFSSWAVLAGVYGYAIQIFCDFSGYSDLAIGIGRLMGFRLPPNFHSPYLAFNLQDFWRRWHISLSRWLRDYLYIPLGGSRRGNCYVNLIVTMGIGGLWHGSHLRFLVWGLMHGAGLAVVHVFHRVRNNHFSSVTLPLPIQGAAKAVSWLVTFHFVALLWVFFRADDMESSFEIFRRLACFVQPGEGFSAWVAVAILAGFLIQIFGGLVFSVFVNVQSRLPWPIQALVLALLAGLILNMGPDGVLPFIYFQF